MVAIITIPEQAVRKPFSGSFRSITKPIEASERTECGILACMYIRHRDAVHFFSLPSS
jgi:hypothetical protein